MKTKILKYLMFACLIAGMPSAFAQNSAHEEVALGSCSVWSKDPKCWEDKNGKPSRPRLCLSESYCGVIKSVRQDSYGKFHCQADDGIDFSCQKLVEEFGTNLEGVQVKITSPYVDACHVLGGCGGNACVRSYGVAKLDPFCQ